MAYKSIKLIGLNIAYGLTYQKFINNLRSVESLEAVSEERFKIGFPENHEKVAIFLEQKTIVQKMLLNFKIKMMKEF